MEELAAICEEEQASFKSSLWHVSSRSLKIFVKTPRVIWRPGKHTCIEGKGVRGQWASELIVVQSILTWDRMLIIGYEMQLWNNCALLLIPPFAMQFRLS